MKKLILSLIILSFFFSCTEDLPEKQDVDYSNNYIPVEFDAIYNASPNEYGFIFGFQDYALNPTTIALRIDVDIRGEGNKVDFYMRGAPQNRFSVSNDSSFVQEITGLMPSRSTDLYVYLGQGENNIEPSYVEGYIDYAIYEGDTIENRDPVRFVLHRAGGELRD